MPSSANKNSNKILTNRLLMFCEIHVIIFLEHLSGWGLSGLRVHHAQIYMIFAD